MSRSNYDKPFYVDVGTSIVAVRCASNHDVVLRYDHERLPQSIKLAEDSCDRMNREVELMNNKYPMMEMCCGTCARWRMIPVCLGGDTYCNKHKRKAKSREVACLDYRPGARSVLATIARFLQKMKKEGGAE